MPVISGSQHSTQTKHSTDFSKAEVIANIQTYHPYIIKEAIKIIKAPQYLQP
jgi:CMP-2-keto-3-deoxyoctulosonic acid synthetase